MFFKSFSTGCMKLSQLLTSVPFTVSKLHHGRLLGQKLCGVSHFVFKVAPITLQDSRSPTFNHSWLLAILSERKILRPQFK